MPLRGLQILLLCPLAWFWPSAACRGDFTLVYGEEGEPTHQVQVREGMVSVANAGDKRLLVFDSRTQRAQVVDHPARQRSELDAAALGRLAAELAETERLFLAGLEDRLAGLPQEEREAMRQVVERLRQASDPARGAAAAEARRFVDIPGNAEHLGQPVMKARVYHGDQTWGMAWLADPEALGIATGDRAVLREFQRFFEQLDASLPERYRAGFGGLALMAPDGRLVAKLERLDEGEEGASGGQAAVPGDRLELLRYDSRPVEPGWFEVPEEFALVPLVPVPKPEAEGEEPPNSSQN